MSAIPQPLQGMSDIISPEVEVWQTLETRAREVLARFDFREVRTPIVEMASVYLHSLGDTSDIVQKQMYAFETRGGKQVCLRPEGTAGVMRHLAGRGQEAQDARVYYMGPMFRAERPQAGRRRQFHQLGVECMGPPTPEQDAEVIALQAALFEAWELGPVSFQLNTRGSPEDFPRILEGLRGELEARKSDLCEDCQRRMDSNVLRVLDCKVPGCKEIVQELSPITTWMDPASLEYFDRVRKTLDLLKVPYEVNPLLVRGLDYYQHSIWEVTSTALGAQDALSGGGRYRMAMGKAELEGVGFGIGMERVLLALSEAQQAKFSVDAKPLVMLVAQNDAAREANLSLAADLRRAGLRVRMDLTGKSMKAQMKAAGRQNAATVLIRGEAELTAGTVQWRDMSNSEQQEVTLEKVVGLLVK
ncbi:MAG: histidine--tRNA ligase [Verrucomicrobia bacterium]|nr:histidine--tRNA ligase [Verrucomicrobiota bacterium]MCH8510189.1 histidine--tRNA ligase [Kiritimatiellia bacterium]